HRQRLAPRAVDQHQLHAAGARRPHVPAAGAVRQGKGPAARQSLLGHDSAPPPHPGGKGQLYAQPIASAVADPNPGGYQYRWGLLDLREEAVMFRKLLQTPPDFVLLVMRVTLGVVFLAHGAQKALPPDWFGGRLGGPGLEKTVANFTG